uniref:Uncharacterized protein n=1 Tax=Arundo donax TaxID=35708 RepID=A0A0A9E6A6_ARUDO
MQVRVGKLLITLLVEILGCLLLFSFEKDGCLFSARDGQLKRVRVILKLNVCGCICLRHSICKVLDK